MASLPSNGRSGAWGISSAPKGYVTADIFVLLLQDLVSFLEKNQIPRPIILFMDGASPHISLAMAEYCKVQDIQPWLFKPNTTHITQPLDLTFMKSLKDVLKKKVTQWQQAHTTSLTKYTVVPLILIHSSVEELLTSRPEVIGNGFCCAGLVPWNPAAVDQKKMLPSSVFRPPVLLESNVSQTLIDPQPGPSGYHHERNLFQPGNQQQPDVGIDLRDLIP